MAKKSDTFLYQILAENKASRAIRGVKDEFAGLRSATFETFGTFSFAIDIAKELGQALVSLGRLSLVPIQYAIEQEKVERQLAAVLKSTGEAAGVTAEHAKKLASSYQGLTTFGDEAIIGAENLLLTFTNIGADGGIFDRTVGTILDMSAALGNDLKGSVLQLGKALNDPVQGVAALREVGVSFTAEQIDLIKSLADTNQLAEAQTLILDELQKEFGGSAAALRDQFGGAVDAVNNQWGDFLEELGFLVTKNPVVLEAIKGIEEVLSEMTASLAEGEDGFSSLRNVINSFISEAIPALLRGMAVGVDALSGSGGLAVAALKTGKAFAQAANAVDAVVTKVQLAHLAWDQFNHDLRGNRKESNKISAEMHKLTVAHREWGDTIDSISELIEKAESGSSAAGDSLRALAGELEAVAAAQQETLGEGAFALGDPGAELAEYQKGLQGLALTLGTITPGGLASSSMAQALFATSEEIGLDALEAGVGEMEDVLSQAEATVKEAQELVKVADSLKQGELPDQSLGEPAGFDLEPDPTAGNDGPEDDKFSDVVHQNSEMALAGMQDVFSAAAAGYQELDEAGKQWADGFKGHLTSAFLEPILGADSAFKQLFNPVFSLVESVGQAIHKHFIEPIIGGIVEFFTTKTALQEADAATSTGIHIAEATKTAAVTNTAVATMMPGLAAAAALSLIGSFGSSASAAALLPGLIGAAQAQGLAAIALADGMHITGPTYALLGEAGEETVIPETRPARARELLMDMLERRPQILGSSNSTGGRGPVILNMTINTAPGQSEVDIGYEIARAVDEILGGQS